MYYEKVLYKTKFYSPFESNKQQCKDVRTDSELCGVLYKNVPCFTIIILLNKNEVSELNTGFAGLSH